MLNALSAAEQAVLSGDEDKLYEALKAMGVQNLQAQNKGWYLKQLQADREAKEQVSGAARFGKGRRLSVSSLLTCSSSSSSGISRRSADQGRVAERRGRGQPKRRRLPEVYAHVTHNSSSFDSGAVGLHQAGVFVIAPLPVIAQNCACQAVFWVFMVESASHPATHPYRP